MNKKKRTLSDWRRLGALLAIFLAMGFLTKNASLRAQTYCTPTYTNACTSGDHIDSFMVKQGATTVFSTAASGCDDPATNYIFRTSTGDTIVLTKGVSYELTVVAGSWNQYFAFWIDANKNGWDASDGIAASGSRVSSWTTTFTAPTGSGSATYDTTRWRIRSSWSSIGLADSCNNQSYGETEDHVVILAPPSGDDVGVSAITNPVTGCGLGASEPVWITIHNYGAALSAGDTVPYSVQVDGGTVCTDTLFVGSGGLATGGDTTFNSGCTGDFSTTGSHTVDAWTSLTGDVDNSNDTGTTTLQNDLLISTFPYTESFETGMGGWHVESNGTTTWEWGDPSAGASPGTINSASDGTHAWETDMNGDYSNSEQGWVLSPCFDFSGLTNAPKLTLSVWWDSEFSWDGGAIDTGDAAGNNWGRLGVSGDPNNWYNDNSISGLNWSGSQHGWTGTGTDGSGGWVDASRIITEYAGRSDYVRFRVLFGSDGSYIDGDGFAFDYVRIEEVQNNDVGVSVVDSPVNGCGLGASEPVWITIHNYGGALSSGTSIPYSVQVDGGTPCPGTYTLASDLATGADITFNSGCTGDFSTVGSHTVDAWTSLTGDVDNSNDTTTATVENKVAPTLGANDVFVDDFECLPALTTQTSGTILMSGTPTATWEYTNTANGRLQTTYTNHTTGGGQAVTLDANPDGTFSDNWMTVTLDLSSYNAATDVLMLEFWWTDHGDETHSGDSVAIRGSSSDPWVKVAALKPGSEANGTWHEVVLNMSDSLVAAGQNYSSTFQIRFSQYDNYATSLDGITYDDIRVYELQPDVGVTSVDSPVSGCVLGASEPVWITIHNYGAALSSGTSIPYSVQVDGGPVCSGTLTVGSSGLPMGSDTTFNSGCTGDFSTVGSHTVDAWTSLTGDVDNSNDTTTATVINDPVISTFPYTESFETGMGGWRVESNGTTTWEWGDPSAGASPGTINSASDGTHAWETDVNGDYSNSEQGWVLSPCFDFSGLTNAPKLTLSVWWDSEFSWDGGAIDTGDAAGNNWGRLGASGDPNNWYNDNSISGLSWSGSQHGWTGTGTSGWVDASRIITEYAGRSDYVRFRVLFGSDGSYIDGDGFAFDYVRIEELQPDVGVTSVDSPVTGCGLGASEPVWITIHNYGAALSSGTSIPYSVQVDGGTPCPGTYTLASDLATGADITFNSGCTGDFSTTGSHTVDAWTSLTGDVDNSNDAGTAAVTSIPTYSSFPHVEGFEGAHYWTFGGTNSSWQVGTPAGGNIDAAGEGSQSLFTDNGGDAYNNSENSWAMSPCYDFSGLTADPIVSFLHAWEIEGGWDEGRLQYSTDGGATWTTLGSTTSGGVNWYNSSAYGWSLSSGNQDWHVASHVLTGLAGQSRVQFRFRLITDGSTTYEGMAVDQFSVLPSGTEVFDPPARPYTNNTPLAVSGSGWTKYQLGGADVLWVDPQGQNLGNTDMKFHSGFPPLLFQDITPNQYMTPRHWVIDPTTQPASNVTVRLFLTEEEWDTLRNRDANLDKGIHLLGVTHYHGPNDHTLSWGDNDYVTGDTDFLAPSVIEVYPWNNGYALEFDVLVFSQFGGNSGGGTNTPLPVEFAWFRAERVGGDALLEWATASERGSDHFRVEVATAVVDGRPAWRLLGTVQAAGESRALRTYRFVDETPGKRGVRYYRIVEVDADGTRTVSEVRKLRFDGLSGGVSVRPNPFRDVLEVLLPSGTGVAHVQVEDARGVTVWRGEAGLGASVRSLRVPAASLPAGVYTVRVVLPDAVEVMKVMKR